MVIGGKYEVTIQKINLKRVAKVSVLPNIDYSGTETTFKFKIGIEKRNNLLKLSPEKAQEKIKSLDGDIKKLDDISSKLGKAVTGLKTACLATGALFTIDNLLANLNGKGLARQKVMRDPGGWYDQCNKWVREKTKVGDEVYSTLQDCLFDNSGKIDKEVDAYYKVLSDQNNDIDVIEKANILKKGGLFSEDVVDSTALIKDYSAKVQSDLRSCGVNTEIANPLKSSEKISAADIKKALSFDTWNKSKNYNFEELRDVGFYCNVLQENPGDARAQQKLYSLLSNVKVNSDEGVKRDTFLSKWGLNSGEGGFISTRKDIKNIEFSTLKTWKEVQSKFTQVIASVPQTLTPFKGRPITPDKDGNIDLSPKDDEYVYFVTDVSNNKEYLIVLSNSYVADRTFEIQGSLLSINLDAVNPIGLSFKKVDASSYSNKYNNPEVKYFETEPFKGAPALVPLDTKEGWYVAMSQTLPGFGNIRSFDESGRVYSYYLGNTGPNGNVDFFEGGGDDIYQLVVLGSKETFSRFSGLSDSKVESLAKKAEDAILSVQRQYPSIVGKADAKVNVQGVGAVKVGQPNPNIPQVECEDFMSPNQCKILFNVCDPVICPSSRCNLGGAYPVSDVVQSGVIGSIALCLPNFQEGIIMPVCLTGVKAGFDNWISIQKSYRDCLQENIDTGKTVGICDEIQSIYACEFFWRQGLPVAKIVVPTLLSAALGQNARGGGEYLGVANAWENAEKSVNYFTQYYADDSFRAFKARSTEEVGGEVCKNFVSGVYPNSGNFLDKLTEPDSPAQFTGRFDEIPFTTATNPPVSQYKVFYHIFAGKDAGAYFRVYLKGAPGSSYYEDTAISRVADFGYIEKGKYKSNTIDFTAPSGYNQMCILVNGQEECGFKQVSTAFTVNYVQDKYLQEQATSTVKSEAECISGTPSLYGLLNPNVQEGVGDFVNPELYNQGIYRICATNNPGQGTGSERWVDVGYCGTQNMRCWLDRESVKNVIKNQNIENDTVESINKQVQANLDAKENPPDFEAKKSEIENENDNFKKINKINAVIGKFFLNKQKGWLLIMRGDVYGKLALELFNKKNQEKTAATPEYCIRSATTNQIFRVNDIDDLVLWCSQNGGAAVCDSTNNNVPILKDSALFECSSTTKKDTTGQTTQPPQEKGPVLPDATLTNRLKDTQLLDRLALYGNIIKENSQKYGISENLIKSVIIQESYAQKDAVNADSRGLMQITDGAALDVKNYYKNTEHDSIYLQYTQSSQSPYIPTVNIKIGTAYLKKLNDYYTTKGNSGENLKKISLAAYNWGPTKVNANCKDTKWENCQNVPSQVLQYVSNIITYEKGLNGEDISSSSSSSQSGNVILLIELKIVTYTAFDNFVGDLMSPDVIYDWDGKSWTGGERGGEINKYAKSTNWEDGIEYIGKKVSSEDDSNAFSRLELTCEDKKWTVATRFNLFSVNVTKTIKQKSEELCRYKA
ncbi:MAG: transglycosylase SLT domain-containing protein [Nanoarchaeota archaeon]